MPDYLIGVDLGQRRDWTAICVAERRTEPTGSVERVPAGLDLHAGGLVWSDRAVTVGAYDVTHLERLPLGTPYVDVAPRLKTIMQRLRERHVAQEFARSGHLTTGAPVSMVVDQTGVGVAVVDLLRDAGLDPIAITITGGDTVSRPAWNEYRTPKRELAGVLQVLLQGRRLRIAEALPLAAVLRQELENFKVTISLGGHDSYGAGEEWRTGNHDDLVLAVALAVWYGERALP